MPLLLGPRNHIRVYVHASHVQQAPAAAPAPAPAPAPEENAEWSHIKHDSLDISQSNKDQSSHGLVGECAAGHYQRLHRRRAWHSERPQIRHARVRVGLEKCRY
jgi:hypothetical protein